MTRWLLIIVALLVVATSAVFGSINAERVTLDLYAGTLSLPLGVVVLGALFIGCVVAGVVLYGTVIVPLRMKLARAKRELARGAPPLPPP